MSSYRQKLSNIKFLYDKLYKVTKSLKYRIKYYTSDFNKNYGKS